ncbi:MAG TPA: benzoate-CoA ligase family protein [Pseudonocardiaceae bacterium]|nr:benzoate-CoA ligase family protein [Pseudonocardiaceae bacterium]
MRQYDDVPARYNIASYFVDRNLELGRGDRTALIHDHGTTTYAELAVLTNRIGNVLRDIGVVAGQRVLLALADGVEFVATWYAAQKIGAVTAEVYTFLPAKDFAYYLGYTEAAVVVVDAATLDRMREATEDSPRPPLLLVVGPAGPLGRHELSFDELVPRAGTELDAAPTTRDDVAIWKFTTGSTGAPKACVHPTRSPLLSFHCYARGVLDIGAEDVVLAVPKLFFGYARDLAALYPFGVGGTGIVFADRSTPERIIELIERHRPTILVNVPTMMSAMVAHVETTPGPKPDFSSLRLCTSAGEALPEQLHRRWDHTFRVPVLDGIGSSEAYHIYVSNRPDATRPGTAGLPVPGYQARVTDSDRKPLPDGEIGALEITGPTTAVEYHGEPAKSAETFFGDTVRSGDLFSRDTAGYFTYRGRADDLLKVGGVWVAPSEIENCLIDHPDVVECAVVGYVDDGLVLPRAYVVVRADADVTPAALREFVKTRLSPHKYPRDVRFVGELPKTGSGKLDRRALKGM